VSKHDIYALDVADYLVQLTEAYDIPHSMLKVEITESAYSDDTRKIGETARKLRQLGFMVLMDDFGSGYSSLNMLKEVPVDRIKLDLRFLTGEGDITRGHIIVSNVIHMIGELDMDVIAEGVETERQANFLSDHGCVDMQGFYFYKPMTVDDFEKTAGL
jgi:EAL domain-containing protein (putative c-di-GMP-specific phosphodiesterase class I)